MSAIIIEGGIIVGIVIGVLQLFFNIFRLKKKQNIIEKPKTQKEELEEKILELETKLDKMKQQIEKGDKKDE